MVGEYSTDEKLLAEAGSVKPGTGAAAPMPTKFFQWPEEDKILVNTTAIVSKDVKWFAKNLSGEQKPERHRWLRINLTAGSEEFPNKYPVPGEFMGLGVRMMPDKPWGKQESSPFLYSGNWMDTVYYTSAVVQGINEPTDEEPYSTYDVKWRESGAKGSSITVRPSDFAEYKVGDRVTILKDVATTKKTQLWKDEDMDTFGDTWMIAPIGFYGLDKEA
jgi:hypothetical protein